MEATFKKFASKANGAELTSSDVNKWAKDAGILGKNLTSNHIDIAFSKVKVKGAKYVQNIYMNLNYLKPIALSFVLFLTAACSKPMEYSLLKYRPQFPVCV